MGQPRDSSNDGGTINARPQDPWMLAVVDTTTTISLQGYDLRCVLQAIADRSSSAFQGRGVDDCDDLQKERK